MTETVTVNSPTQQVINTNVAAFVDIYTQEGLKLTGNSTRGAIISLTTSKDINKTSGEFTLVLAPQNLVTATNGQQATNLSFSEVITPMSTVIIGLYRGNRHAIVMIGLVENVTETQSWVQGESTRRSITVTGKDFGKYFEMPDYYSLYFLASTGDSQASVAGVLDAGLTSGNPGQVAQNWFTQIMLKNGTFQNTAVRYQDSWVTLDQAFGIGPNGSFDQYDANIPFGYYYIGMNEQWVDKFREILQPPFYEFFITTAGFSDNFINPYNTEGLTNFQVTGLPNDDASPIVIGRRNPIPMLVGTVGDGNAAEFNSVDSSLWNALTEYTLDISNSSFLSSSITFSDDGTFNFFIVNPYFATGQIGGSNQNILPPIFLVGGAMDEVSIARYGYRPRILGTHWMADPTGQVTAGGFSLEDMQALSATLLGRLASVYEPLSLMASAIVTTTFRPDIQIGNKFTYAPFKDLVPWTFYVESVSHSFTFGQRSITTLGLTRGLPKSVYADSSMMLSILTGNAQRVNGEYVSGVPEQFSSLPTLKGLSVQQLASWIQQLQEFYTAAQKTN